MTVITDGDEGGADLGMEVLVQVNDPDYQPAQFPSTPPPPPPPRSG